MSCTAARQLQHQPVSPDLPLRLTESDSGLARANRIPGSEAPPIKGKTASRKRQYRVILSNLPPRPTESGIGDVRADDSSGSEAPSVLDNAASGSSADAGLMYLPDELLLKVAKSLDGKNRNSSLQSLALTNRRLSGVAQETLLQETVVKMKNIWSLTETVLIRPEFAQKIMKLRIISFDPQISGRKKEHVRLDRRGRDACRNVFKQVFPEDKTRGWIASIKKWSGVRDSVALAVILLMASNLKGISVETCQELPELYRLIFDPNTFASTQTPKWEDMVREFMRPKLEMIDLSTTGPCYRDFDQFEKLKRLGVPITSIRSRRDIEAESPYDMLPRNLQELNLYANGSQLRRNPMIVGWLSAFMHHMDQFESLRRIHIFVDDELDNIAFDIRTKDLEMTSWMELLQEWKSFRVPLEMFFRVEGKFEQSDIVFGDRAFSLGCLLSAQEPSSEEPSSEEPFSKEPSSEEPSSKKLSSEKPFSKEPSSEEISSEELSSEEPSSEELSSEKPSSEEPSSEEPSSKELSSEEPSSEKPFSEEPSSEEPSSEEPSSEEPSGEEPSGEEPSVEKDQKDFFRLRSIARWWKMLKFWRTN